MIENIIKEELNINKFLGEKGKNIKLSEDFIISDSKPDVLSIVDENANVFIKKVEISENKIRLNGVVEARVLYLADNGENRSIVHTFEFSEIIEFENISEEMQIMDKIKKISMRSKIINERKLNIEIDLEISITVNKKDKLEYVSNFENDKNIQALRKDIELKKLVGVGKSKSTVRENLPIDNIDQVLDIISTDINVRNIENKLSVNKVLSKADVEIEVVYITVDGHINSSKKEFQAMGFIDIENIDDNNLAHSEYILRNVNIGEVGRDEHNINVELDFDILGEVYDTQKINIINDLYSLKQELEVSKKIEKIRYADLSLEVFEISENTNIDELENIIKVGSNAVLKSINYIDETSKISGEIEYKILYEKQNVSGIFLKTLRVPFEKSINRKISKDARLEILENKFIKRETNIEMVSKIKIVSYCNNNFKFEFVDNVSEIENDEKEDLYSLVIYFVKKDDTLWKIAKKFRTSVEEIVKVNNIEDENYLEIGKKLYIPKVA